MVITWLIEGGVGPALVALPVNWTAAEISGVAERWFRRLRRTDDLSRLVKAATGNTVDISRGEFDDVRRLLEDQQTWSLVGRGTVEDLANWIASCLPARDGRTAEDSCVAAVTIARGLLEFVVADLDPKLFQQVLLARLQRMEADQVSALDEALLGLHADLITRLDDLEQVLDRLPPDPARRGEVTAYLRTLIDWLSRDPWPLDGRFGGPVLTPAVIERKLRVTVTDRASEQDLDADDLTQRCQRLVILGGPGSGKTWLAKRSARRRAEDALEALAAGGTLDEIELPLYTTCSRLFAAAGNIREAAVSSAIDQLSDLGGSRISAALRLFFAERNAPTVLVIDSLDEAHGSDERLFQADTLPWRIVLTTRPNSWNHQLDIDEKNDCHRVGELQPLRYPGDVNPFIQRWFETRPQRGNDLAAEIARRPSLQQGATVPLILAFYCIVGGSEPLPVLRRDLYARVLRRMLTGRWRGRHDRQPDADVCIQTLRAWAWAGAVVTNPVSGIGMWSDDMPTEGGRLKEADEDALDHVAVPLAPPDIDTGWTLRRFIHRSIREQLVAEYIANLPVDQAVEVLLPHLWYDADWEYSAPLAIAMHPQHDQLLRDLICRASRSDRIVEDISAINGGMEFQGLLARIAAESVEADWSSEIANIIGQARVEFARSAIIYDFGAAASWAASSRQARNALLELLGRQVDGQAAWRLVRGLVQLDPSVEDRRQARNALLVLLFVGNNHPWFASLMSDVVLLCPTPEDKRQARQTLIGLLNSHIDSRQVQALANGVVQLARTAEDKREALHVLLELLPGQTDGLVTAWLLDQTAQLTLTLEDKRQVRAVLLSLLHGQPGSYVAARLAAGMGQLDPTVEDLRLTLDALLGLLGDEADGWEASWLVEKIAQFSPTVEDRRLTLDALLTLLDRQAIGSTAARMASAVVLLDPTTKDKRRAIDTLLGLLAQRPDSSTAADLVGGLIKLDPSAEDKCRAREALLRLLADPFHTGAADLVGGLIKLDPSAEDKRRAREALLRLLADPFHTGAADLVGGLIKLDPSAEDKRQAREALLRPLVDWGTTWEVDERVSGLIKLDLSAEDKRQAREALLRPLVDRGATREIDERVSRLLQLDLSAEDKREALIQLVAHEAVASCGQSITQLLSGVVQLDPSAEDKRRAREALLGLITIQVDGKEAAMLAGGLAQLDPTAKEKRLACEALLKLLAEHADRRGAAQLVSCLAQLNPTVHDLSSWRAWAIAPTIDLLAAARWNSALADWIAALPSLTKVSA